MQYIPIRALRTIDESQTLINEFSVRDISSLLQKEDLVQDLHRHDFYYLLVIEKGRGSHEIDFNSYPVLNRSLFFMRPGQVHQHRLERGSIAHIIAFSLAYGKDSPQHLRKASQINYYSFSKSEFERIQTLTKLLWQEAQEKSQAYKHVVKALLEALFVELIRRQRSNSSQGSISFEQNRLEEFQALIEANLHKHKQVAQYAALLNLSTYQLNAITKATVGKTPSALLNDQIILEARRYLLGTSNQVNQVAHYLGYEDVSYFIRFFKKHTGFTPEAYRQNFR